MRILSYGSKTDFHSARMNYHSLTMFCKPLRRLISAFHIVALTALLPSLTTGQYFESDVIGVDKNYGLSEGYLSDQTGILDEIRWCLNIHNSAFRRIELVYTNGET